MQYSDSQYFLGTNVEVIIISENNKTPQRIQDIFDFLESFEQEFSRFRKDSVLNQLNTLKSYEVSSRFIDLMLHAKIQFEKTNGYFNPLIQIAKLGYSHSFEEGKFERSNTTDTDIDFSKIQIVKNRVTLGENQLLDFGGIGKGYAVDKAAEMLKMFGYEHFLINAGGDIYLHGLNGDGEGWIVGIEDPFTGNTISSVSVSDRAVATSGRYKRKWNIEGKENHHIINPFTGMNENAIMSVTIIGNTCIECDTFTKKIFNLSILEGIDSLEKNNMEGLIYLSDGSIHMTKGLIENCGYRTLESSKI